MKKPQSKEKLFKEVGEKLRQLRANKSQKQMAEELGVPFRSYCRYESGERPPPLPLSIKIARLNKTTVDWLMGGIPTEEGDQFNENYYRHELIGRLIKELELSLEREHDWFQRQGFEYPESEDESFQGWKDFTDFLHEYYEQYADPQSVGSVGPVEPDYLPREIILITRWLKEFWANASEDEKIWMKVQFRKCFPQFLEWLQKHDYATIE